MTSIAAILTIVGYSLNETVVVFDRTRELMRRYKTHADRRAADLSINPTMSRTDHDRRRPRRSRFWRWCSSAARRSRASPRSMLFGVVICTYSAIFISSPMLIYLGLRRLRRRRARSPEGKARRQRSEPMSGRPRSTTASCPGRHLIDAYGNGGFRFADMSHRGSILALPSGRQGLAGGRPSPT